MRPHANATSAIRAARARVELKTICERISGKSIVLAAAVMAFAGAVEAQEGGLRPGDESIVVPPMLSEQPSRSLVLPVPPPLSAEEEMRLSSGALGFVAEIVVEGSTVFDAETLDELMAPFEGRLLGSEDLYQARDAV